MSDPIQDAIDKAKAAAATTTEAAAANSNLPAVAPQAGGVPARLTARDMQAGSFSVDAYLKVSENGMSIGNSAIVVGPLRMKLDLSEVFFHFAIKYGNPAQYQKTVNQQTTLQGQSWVDALATGARVDGIKFKGAYRSADVPMTLFEDVIDIKKAKAASAGARIGKSLSTTEWKEFDAFLRSVTKAGLDENTAVVEVLVDSKARTGSGNTWGVTTYTLVGAYEVAKAA